MTGICVALASFLLFTGNPAAFAGDPVPIGTLLSSSSFYDHHSVTIQGTARQVDLYPPQRGYGCVMYGAYAFTLDDDTGSIQVNVNGSCTPGLVFPVGTAAKVVVEGIFHATSRSGIAIRSSPQLEAKTIHELP